MVPGDRFGVESVDRLRALSVDDLGRREAYWAGRLDQCRWHQQPGVRPDTAAVAEGDLRRRLQAVADVLNERQRASVAR